MHKYYKALNPQVMIEERFERCCHKFKISTLFSFVLVRVIKKIKIMLDIQLLA